VGFCEDDNEPSGFHKIWSIPETGEQLLAFEEWLCSMEASHILHPAINSFNATPYLRKLTAFN
jgi:hypothetical protein